MTAGINKVAARRVAGIEDRSRRRAVAGELRLRTVGEVESKEWRQEDASRMHPQGLMGARVLEVEPRPVGGGMT